VKFDPELVRDSINATRKSVRIWDRSGAGFIEISDHQTCFFPGMTAIKILDAKTGEHRTSTREDLAAITRVADALPEIDGVCVPCKIVEHSNVQGEMEEFAVMAMNTTKPLEYLCESDLALEAVIEMATAVRGGANRLAEKPYFFHQVTPLPLYYAKQHSDQIIRAVESGIPLFVGTVTMGGASTPMTIAGNLVHGLATDLTSIVLSQLVRRGCFCIASSDIAFMDPATGAMGGVSQGLLAEMAMCQIMRLLGLPALAGSAGTARGHRLNQEAVSQATVTMMEAFYTRPAICDYLGLMDGGITYSLHLLLLDHDLVGLLRRLWKGVRVDDETLALDVTQALGPQGNFLAQRHTARHCRSELWQPRYYRSRSTAQSKDDAERDLIDRIDDDLREILRTHRPEALPDPIRRKINSILEKSSAQPIT
jgi:trimethylamine:corrinoid methyltransferase-like protein